VFDVAGLHIEIAALRCGILCQNNLAVANANGLLDLVAGVGHHTPDLFGLQLLDAEHNYRRRRAVFIFFGDALYLAEKSKTSPFCD
jgi:hypothetical protein